MGKPLSGQETKKQLESQAHELATLYINAFKQFYNVLKPKGAITGIIPKFKKENDWVTINCLEQLKNVGFTLVPLSQNSDSLLYHRKNQHVGREIWKFVKK